MALKYIDELHSIAQHVYSQKQDECTTFLQGVCKKLGKNIKTDSCYMNHNTKNNTTTLSFKIPPNDSGHVDQKEYKNVLEGRNYNIRVCYNFLIQFYIYNLEKFTDINQSCVSNMYKNVILDTLNDNIQCERKEGTLNKNVMYPGIIKYVQDNYRKFRNVKIKNRNIRYIIPKSDNETPSSIWTPGYNTMHLIRNKDYKDDPFLHELCNLMRNDTLLTGFSGTLHLLILIVMALYDKITVDMMKKVLWVSIVTMGETGDHSLSEIFIPWKLMCMMLFDKDIIDTPKKVFSTKPTDLSTIIQILGQETEYDVHLRELLKGTSINHVIHDMCVDRRTGKSSIVKRSV